MLFCVAFESYKSEKKEARTQKSKKAASLNGMSQEELIEMQQKLFQQAREKQNSQAGGVE
jgi:hypothetical protein